MKEKFCDLLRRLRKEKNITIKELSELSGISMPNISLLENGKIIPRPQTIHKLATVLECDYDLLFESVNY